MKKHDECGGTAHISNIVSPDRDLNNICSWSVNIYSEFIVLYFQLQEFVFIGIIIHGHVDVPSVLPSVKPLIFMPVEGGLPADGKPCPETGDELNILVLYSYNELLICESDHRE